MTKEEAIKQAYAMNKHLPFRIWGIAGKDGDWIIFNGYTKAKANNLYRKGYEFYTI